MYRGEPTRVNLNEGALKFPERAPGPRKSGWERTTYVLENLYESIQFG